MEILVSHFTNFGCNTIEKLNNEIIKITESYSKILILQQVIYNTNNFNIEQSENVKKLIILTNAYTQVGESRKKLYRIDPNNRINIKVIEDEFQALHTKISAFEFKLLSIDHIPNFRNSNGFENSNSLNGFEFSSYIKLSHTSMSNDELQNKNDFYGSVFSKKILDDIYIMFLQLVNYNLDKKNELKNFIEMYGTDENIKYKLTNLYEARIK